MNNIQKQLFMVQDKKYREFHIKLVPGLSEIDFIGVRNPDAKKIAKEAVKQDKTQDFIKQLPHKYYDENNVHSYIINEVTDYNKAIGMLNDFLPYVNNWATCDIIRPKIFKKHTSELLQEIKKWIKSNHVYTIRFGIEMLMCYYLDEEFDTKYLDIPTEIKSNEYYVNMMIAWFYATALAKQYEDTIKIIESKKLDKWIQNKSIQKAIESYRVSNEHKEYLRTLRK